MSICAGMGENGFDTAMFDEFDDDSSIHEGQRASEPGIRRYKHRRPAVSPSAVSAGSEPAGEPPTTLSEVSGGDNERDRTAARGQHSVQPKNL